MWKQFVIDYLSFSKKERQAIYEIGHGAPVMRALSGLSPGNNFASWIRAGLAGGTVGYLSGTPWLGAVPPAVGKFARTSSGLSTRRNVAIADQLARGGPVPSKPMMGPLSMFYATSPGVLSGNEAVAEALASGNVLDLSEVKDRGVAAVTRALQ